MEDEILINQKNVKKNKVIKKNLKLSKKIYSRQKTFIGKFYFGNEITLLDLTKSNLSNKDLITLVEENDLRGMSGNNFKVSTKLRSFKDYQGKKSLIVNGIECDPSLIHDSLIIDKYIKEVEAGMKIMKDYFQISNLYLAIPNKGLQESENDLYQKVVLDLKYPLGEEHILIKEMLGIDLDNKIPTESGILVMNVQTILNIYLITNGLYKKGRFVTISDFKEGKAIAKFVEYNTPIKEVIKDVSNNNSSTYAGSGLFNAHLISNDEVITPSINLITTGEFKEIPDNKKCLGCGRCSKRCPMGIDVRSIVKSRLKDKNASISKFNPEKCIHCNLCVYGCGAGLNIKKLF